jgi:hypothetical protein
LSRRADIFHKQDKRVCSDSFNLKQQINRERQVSTATLPCLVDLSPSVGHNCNCRVYALRSRKLMVGDNLRDLVLDGRIIIQQTLNKGVMTWTGFKLTRSGCSGWLLLKRQ